MAIVKRNFIIEHAKFIFSDTGEVTDIELQVNFQLYDDIANEQVTRAAKVESIWANLNSGHQTQANVIGQRLKALAEAF